MLALLAEKKRRQDRRKIDTYYPAGGPLRRALYPRHMEFFRAGAHYRERGVMAANRIGKTEGMGGYEMALHLTGLYPDWWEGRRFDHPVAAWAAGRTNETTRDIIQAKLCGPVAGQPKNVAGTGLIPGAAIGRPKWKRGVMDMIDTLPVRHHGADGREDGWSQLGFKSYEQGRGTFEGTEKHVIWLDEECSMEVYNECLMRTATTRGLMIVTFTPLEGLTHLALSFLPQEYRPGEGHAVA